VTITTFHLFRYILISLTSAFLLLLDSEHLTFLSWFALGSSYSFIPLIGLMLHLFSFNSKSRHRMPKV